MDNTKTIAITGTTNGIGKDLAILCAKNSHNLLLIARDSDKNLQLKNEINQRYPKIKVDLYKTDLSSIVDIKKLSNNILSRYNHLDVLVNSAGTISSDRIITEEGIEKTFAVNFLSHALLAVLLKPALLNSKQGRIIQVASLIPPIAKINFEDINLNKKYTATKAYLQAKVADVMYVKFIAKQWKDTNITINSVHPGVVKTNLGKNSTKGLLSYFVSFSKKFLAIPSEVSAQRIYKLATEDEYSKYTGEYFKVGENPVATNSFSNKIENQLRLAEIVEQYFKLNL